MGYKKNLKLEIIRKECVNMSEHKSRLFSLLQILIKETDDEHKLTTNQLIERLSEQGFAVHRNTIPSEIELLQKAGVDAICEKSTQNRYFIGSRNFEPTELKMLCDAVNAAQFISKEKSAELIDKLFSQISDYQTQRLKSIIQEPNISKSDSKSVYSADVINTAITQGKKIEFQYFEYNSKREKVLKHDGRVYTVSPYAAVWNDDRYYLVGFCEKHKDITVFRIDRISGIKLTEYMSRPCPENFDLKSFLSQTFKMFRGELAEVELKCRNRHMKAIVDKFGDDVKTTMVNKQYFKVKVNVELSPSFYGWLFQFEGEITIQSPQLAIEQFVRMGEGVFGEY